MQRSFRLFAALLATTVVAMQGFALQPVGAADPAYPAVRRDVPIAFPHDHGAHPAYRTEWWYITGWVRDAAGHERGIQVTFFRNRPGVAEANPSAFAAKQLFFAHAAVADPRLGALRHDQRAARAGFQYASAAEGRTEVRIGDWTLVESDDGYVAAIPANGFALDLNFRATEPVLLEGDNGFSRKGPEAGHASYYYSRPHLAVSGTLEIDGTRVAVTGEAWLDHEWSSEYLAPEAAGWDWVGLNLRGGGALMAFRIRDRQGATFWAGGTLRDADGAVHTFTPDAVRFTPLRTWRSPRTQATYPVAMRIEAGGLVLELEPLMDDQELDARASVGTVYWEGAVRVLRDGKMIGRGYLELTGYWQALKL
jgi:predicted secreted hydrolase